MILIRIICYIRWTLLRKDSCGPKTANSILGRIAGPCSFGIHALLAARLGREEQAVRYFEKSLFLDLKNVMQNTGKEGIHTASLGATWQALVLGFGGLSVDSGTPAVENRLPAGIEEMRYRIRYKGIPYRIVLRKNRAPEVIPEG